MLFLLEFPRQHLKRFHRILLQIRQGNHPIAKTDFIKASFLNMNFNQITWLNDCDEAAKI